jgi:hypothetical protein
MAGKTTLAVLQALVQRLNLDVVRAAAAKCENHRRWSHTA